MAKPKMAKISLTNTPNKKYGGEDTRTAVQAVNVGIRNSFKSTPANKALNKKIKQSVVSTPARRATNAAIKASKPRKGIGTPVSRTPTKKPLVFKNPIKVRGQKTRKRGGE